MCEPLPTRPIYPTPSPLTYRVERAPPRPALFRLQPKRLPDPKRLRLVHRMSLDHSYRCSLASLLFYSLIIRSVMQDQPQPFVETQILLQAPPSPGRAASAQAGSVLGSP